MKTNRQIIKVTVDPDGDDHEIECVPAEFALKMENDLYEAAKIMHRLLRYADKTAENHPKAVTSAGQNARVFAGIWLAKFERENADNQNHDQESRNECTEKLVEITVCM